VTVCTSKQVSAYGPGARATQHAIIALDVGTVRESNGAHGTLTEMAHTCHTRMYGATAIRSHSPCWWRRQQPQEPGSRSGLHSSPLGTCSSTYSSACRQKQRRAHELACFYDESEVCILHRHSQHSLANNNECLRCLCAYSDKCMLM
jgi:hypothetical protein